MTVRFTLALLLVGASLIGCGDSSSGAAAQSDDEEPREQSAAGEGAALTESAEGTPERDGPDPVAMRDQPIRCVVPAVPIPRPRTCRRNGYPRCKWQMPHATTARGTYRRWRNTIMEHWWARPALIQLLLASADAFERRYPDQVLAIGDLDAPGPRHATHDNGVDVDLYLLGAMLTENAGRGRYPDNYEGKTEAEVRELRDRVLTLAKILTTCAQGKVRIYYNDEPLVAEYLAWYAEQGFGESPFEAPMVTHNRLHRFHFHMTIAEDLAELPMPEVEHPFAPIRRPPRPGDAPHLSSMSRR